MSILRPLALSVCGMPPTAEPLWRTALEFCEEENFKAAAAQLLKEIDKGNAAAAASLVLVIAGNHIPPERVAERNLVIDGVGFSNWDVEDGLGLARLLDQGIDLTPRHSGLCVKLARKYTEQCMRTVYRMGDSAMRRLFAGKDVKTGRPLATPTPPPKDDQREEPSGGSEETADFLDDDDGDEGSESGPREEEEEETIPRKAPIQRSRGGNAGTAAHLVATPKKMTPKRTRHSTPSAPAPKVRRQTNRKLSYDDGYDFVVDDDEEEDDDADYSASDKEDDGGQATAVVTRGAVRRGTVTEPTATTADEATLAVLRAELALLQRMHEDALRLAKEAEAEAKRRRSAAASLAKELEGKQQMLDSALRARGGRRR